MLLKIHRQRKKAAIAKFNLNILDASLVGSMKNSRRTVDAMVVFSERLTVENPPNSENLGAIEAVFIGEIESHTDIQAESSINEQEYVERTLLRRQKWENNLVYECESHQVVGLFKIIEINGAISPPQYLGDKSRDEIHYAELEGVHFIKNDIKIDDFSRIEYYPSSNSLSLRPHETYLLFLSKTNKGRFQGRQILLVDNLLKGIEKESIINKLSNSCVVGNDR